MTGKTTLFPNTADAALFNDPRDAEINSLIDRIPKDRDGRLPEVERIFGSLPVGDSDAELATVTVPGLGADLIAVHDAWTAGDLTSAFVRAGRCGRGVGQPCWGWCWALGNWRGGCGRGHFAERAPRGSEAPVPVQPC